MTLLEELTKLLNRFSMENASNTPDYILAGFLNDCLRNFNASIRQRERWYGRQAPEETIIPPNERDR